MPATPLFYCYMQGVVYGKARLKVMVTTFIQETPSRRGRARW